MTKKTIILLLFILSGAALRAQESTAATNVLRMPTSVRATAIGGENVSVIDDNVALGIHNPALLSNVSNNTLGLEFMTYATGSKHMGAQFAHAFGERHTGAAYMNFMTYGEMQETATDGSVIGTFRPLDVTFGVGYSYLLSDRWSGGANLRMASSRLADYNAFSLSVDVGLNYFNPDKDFSFGLVARNAGMQLTTFSGQPERVPFSLQAGFSKSLGTSPFHFNVTVVDLTRWRSDQYYTERENGRVQWTTNIINHIVFGVDYISPNDTFWLGLGYNFRRAYELKAAGSSALAGLSAGAGVHLHGFSFGLSYARYHRAYSSLMFNASYSF